MTGSLTLTTQTLFAELLHVVSMPSSTISTMNAATSRGSV